MSSIGHAHFIRVSLPCNNVRLWNISMKQSQCHMSSNYYPVCLSWATREIGRKKSLIYGLLPVCPAQVVPSLQPSLTYGNTNYYMYNTLYRKLRNPRNQGMEPGPEVLSITRKGPTCRSTIVHHSKPLGGIQCLDYHPLLSLVRH